MCQRNARRSGNSAELRGLTEAASRPVDIFTTGAVPGRSAALDVCVQRPPTQQQLVEMQHKPPLNEEHSVLEANFQTFEHKAADIAACRDGQQMSTKALQHAWKHEFKLPSCDEEQR